LLFCYSSIFTIFLTLVVFIVSHSTFTGQIYLTEGVNADDDQGDEAQSDIEADEAEGEDKYVLDEADDCPNRHKTLPTSI
jgi:hypothetical protein